MSLFYYEAASPCKRPILADDRVPCLFCRSACMLVGLHVDTERVVCKNGRFDRDAVWVVGRLSLSNHVLDWGPDDPTGRDKVGKGIA